MRKSFAVIALAASLAACTPHAANPPVTTTAPIP
jgi:hypothetical protein